MPLEMETEDLLKTKLHDSTRISQWIIYTITDSQEFVNTFLNIYNKRIYFQNGKNQQFNQLMHWRDKRRKIYRLISGKHLRFSA